MVQYYISKLKLIEVKKKDLSIIQSSDDIGRKKKRRNRGIIQAILLVLNLINQKKQNKKIPLELFATAAIE